MRIGTVAKLIPGKSFGFIRCGNFREDVFFHFNHAEPNERPDYWEEGDEVEFELDELRRLETQELRTKSIRRAQKPQQVKIADGGTRVDAIKHHPRARQRKPHWRSSE